MANNILYTGRNLTPVLQNDGGQAMGRLSDAIIKAEETKYNTFKENEKEFLKTSNIDPAFFISTANQQAQGKLLEDYNKKWSQRMKASGNNMPLEDKQQMIAEKNLIIAQQQKMQSDQDLWQQHRTMVAQNPNKFDADEFALADAEYRKTGEYKLIRPPVKARSLDMALEDNAVTGNEINETIPEKRDNLSGFTDVRYSATPEQAKERVKQLILGDESYAKDAIKQFQSLPLEEKMPYLTDTNKDGKIDERDKGDENAIIRWAQETKWEKARKKDVLAWRKTEVAAPKKGMGFIISWGGRDTAVPVGQKRKVGINYGGEVKNNLYSFGGSATLSDFPTDGASALYDTSKEPLQGGTNIAGQLVDYDADSDKLIIRTTTSNETLGLDPKQLVEIDANIVPDVNNLPIMVDGKQTTLGTLRGTKTAKPVVKKKAY